MAFDRQDLYTKITNKIIADLEKGVRPWMKPWSAEHLESPILRPLRSTGQRYQGINTVMLWWAALSNGYKCQYWFTYNQAKALGGQVRKGETGETVVYAARVTKKAEVEGDDPKSFSMLKAYTVFNGDQCDGLPEKFFEEVSPPVFTSKQKHDASEAFFAKTGALLRHAGNKAFYSPHGDFIQMPPFETFKDSESYAATKLHELIHWTLHAKRLDRDYGKRFGDTAYAREELVAEIGAAFLCADLGITPEVREDHVSYLASWLKVLKGDKRAIFNAASQAQRAVDFLHGLVNPNQEDVEAGEEVGLEMAA